jgi:hypothetical protein
MSRIMNRKWVVSIIASLLLTICLAGVASAHTQSIIVEKGKCETDGTMSFNITVNSWHGGFTDGNNSRIDLQQRLNGSSTWVTIKQGVFTTANGGTFTYKAIVAGNVSQAQYRALAVNSWGDGAGGGQTSSTVTADISAGPCTVVKATVKIVKTVVGGNAQPNDFDFFIGAKSTKQGIAVEVTPGTIQVSENHYPGYSAGNWTGDCNASGQVTVSAGQNKICRITNTAEPTTEQILACKYKDLIDFGKLNDGEPALPNWVLFWDRDGSHNYTSGDVKKTTGDNGCVSFELPFGDSTICEELQSNWANTTPICQVAHVTIKPPSDVIFLNRLKRGTVKVFKFNDADQSDTKGDNEGGIDGVTFNLYKKGSTEVMSTTVTLGDGNSPILSLPAGDYTICEVVPYGWTPTGNVCRDFTIEDNKLILKLFGNFKPPTALPDGPPPSQPSRVFIPSIISND